MDGILIIDKPYGMTSHDVVNWLRKKYKQKKKVAKKCPRKNFLHLLRY